MFQYYNSLTFNNWIILFSICTQQNDTSKSFNLQISKSLNLNHDLIIINNVQIKNKI